MYEFFMTGCFKITHLLPAQDNKINVGYFNSNWHFDLTRL